MSLLEKIKKQFKPAQTKPRAKKRPTAGKAKKKSSPLPVEVSPKPGAKVSAATPEATRLGEAGNKEKWFEPKAELPIDVIQAEKEIIIQAPLAGVKKENLEILIEKETVKIRGSREKSKKKQGSYLYQECYWGSFSREIILPIEVIPSRAEASLKEGLLTLRIPLIPRIKARSKVEVIVEEETEEKEVDS